MELKYKSLALLLAGSMMLTGCNIDLGNGNEEDGNNDLQSFFNEFGEKVTDDTSTASGVVMDGYLVKAKVCLDVNENNYCDDKEPSTTSKDGGAYTLEAPAVMLEDYPILVEAIAGETVDEDTGIEIEADFVLSAPAGKHETVSPLTTLVQARVKSEGISPDVAEYLVKDSLGMPKTVSLFDDYMEKKAGATSDDYDKMHSVAKVLTKQIQSTIADGGVSEGEKSEKMAELFNNVLSVVTSDDNIAAIKTAYASDAAAIEAVSVNLKLSTEQKEKLEVFKYVENDSTFEDLLKGDGVYSFLDGEAGYEVVQVANPVDGVYDLTFKEFVIDESTGAVTEKTDDGTAGREESYYSINENGDWALTTGDDNFQPNKAKFLDNGKVEVWNSSNDEMKIIVEVAEKYALDGSKLASIFPFYSGTAAFDDPTDGDDYISIRLKLQMSQDEEYRIYPWFAEEVTKTDTYTDTEGNEHNNTWTEHQQCEPDDSNTESCLDFNFVRDDNNSALASFDDLKKVYAYNAENLWKGFHISWDEETNRGLMGQIKEDGTIALIVTEHKEVDGQYEYFTHEISDTGTLTEKTVGNNTILVIDVPGHLLPERERNIEAFYTLIDGKLKQGFHIKDGKMYQEDQDFNFNKEVMDFLLELVPSEPDSFAGPENDGDMEGPGSMDENMTEATMTNSTI